MDSRWETYLDEPGLTRVDGGIDVRLRSGRRQKVSVEDRTDAFVFRSIVARPAVVKALKNAALQAWTRNRAVTLVGFRVDDRGRMIGEAWLPTFDLTRDEFLLALRHVAVECDRYEFQLTGEDRE